MTILVITELKCVIKIIIKIPPQKYFSFIDSHTLKFLLHKKLLINFTNYKNKFIILCNLVLHVIINTYYTGSQRKKN